MKIGLNLLHCQPGIGGVWQYIDRLLKAIAGYDQQNEYWAFVTRHGECLVPRQENFRRVRIDSIGTSRAARVFYENVFLDRWVRKLGLDCLHWFSNTMGLRSSVPGVISIYDLLAYHHPEDYSAAFRAYFRIMYPLGARRAAVVLPMSEATAADVHEILGVPKSRMVVVRTPLNEAFRPAPLESVWEFKKKYALPELFWLYVAHYGRHKNHGGLFRAYSEVKARHPGTWPLVLCGQKNGAEAVISRTLRDLGIEQNVLWLPRLADEEMPLLYSGATVLVFPSLFEGGGMPVMEAMVCGCPAVVSDIPALRECAEDAALQFPAGDDKALGNAMQTMAGDSNLRERYRAAGLSRAATFRPGPVAATLLDVYERAVRGAGQCS